MEEQQRRYVTWKGSNYFLCYGHIMFGSHPFCFLVTFSLVITTFIVYSVWSSSNFHFGFRIFACVLLIIIIRHLWGAATRDPGIIPRDTSTPHIHRIPQKLDADGKLYKYCDTCNIYRPPRCKHCRFCDNCVEEFDHHCPWVGNCIGRRNYRNFIIFLFTLMLLCYYILFCSISDIILQILKEKHDKWWQKIGYAIYHQPASFTLIFWMFPVCYFTTNLAKFHLNLLIVGETTNENIRDVYYNHENPYNKGFIGNCIRLCCQRPPKSKLKLHERCSIKTPTPSVAPSNDLKDASLGIDDNIQQTDTPMIQSGTSISHAHSKIFSKLDSSNTGMPNSGSLIMAPSQKVPLTVESLKCQQGELDIFSVSDSVIQGQSIPQQVELASVESKTNFFDSEKT